MHPLFPFLLRPRRILFIFSESRFPFFRAPILVRLELPAAIFCVGTSSYAARVRFLIRVGGGGAFFAAVLTPSNVELPERGDEVGVLLYEGRILFDNFIQNS